MFNSIDSYHPVEDGSYQYAVFFWLKLLFSRY